MTTVVYSTRRKTLWTNTTSFATTLTALAAQTFGTDYLDWDPETIKMEIDDEAGGQVPESNFNKLMAGVQILTTDSFYRSLPDFIHICNALYSGHFNPTVFDPADAGEIAWGVAESVVLWPPDKNTVFDDEIKDYIAAALKMEGIMRAPNILAMANLDDDVQLWQQAHGDFSDDPSMFNAIYQIESDKVEEINAMVKTRLHILTAQLKSIGIDLAE